jgi:hypothetical protein
VVLGLVAQFWRDLSDPYGSAALIWPISDRSFGLPTCSYAAVIAAIVSCVLATITFRSTGPKTSSPMWLPASDRRRPARSRWTAATRRGCGYGCRGRRIRWRAVHGGDPTLLFKSRAGGESWQLNEAIRRHGAEDNWQPGRRGLSPHSVVRWPGAPRLLVADVTPSITARCKPNSFFHKLSPRTRPPVAPECERTLNSGRAHEDSCPEVGGAQGPTELAKRAGRRRRSNAQTARSCERLAHLSLAARRCLTDDDGRAIGREPSLNRRKMQYPPSSVPLAVDPVDPESVFVIPAGRRPRPRHPEGMCGPTRRGRRRPQLDRSRRRAAK